MAFSGWFTLASFIITVLIIYFLGWWLYEAIGEKAYGKIFAAIITAALILVGGMVLASVVL